MNSAHRVVGLVAALATTLVACQGTPDPRAPSESALLDELGGVEALRPIVDEWMWRLATDDMIGPSVVATEVQSVKEQTLLFVCAALGGTCLDSGDRPLIPFSGSPSGAARRVVSHLRDAALARGTRAELVERLVKQIERDVRAFIGPPRG